MPYAKSRIILGLAAPALTDGFWSGLFGRRPTAWEHSL